MRFLQLNLNHCEAAQELLTQTTREMNADVAILSEPYKQKEQDVWAKNNSGNATIWTCGRKPYNILSRSSYTGFARAESHL